MSDTQLKLYVDPSWCRKGLHAPFLYPFWGNPNTESSLFAKEMFDAHSFDTRLYTITTNLPEADMVFAPYRHVWLLKHDPQLLQMCIAVAEKSGKPLLIDGMGDVEFPIAYKDAYVLRIGGYRFLPERNRIQLPPASDDLLERCRGGELSIREKQPGPPRVGFAAWVQYPLGAHVKTVIKEAPTRFRSLVDDRYRACQKGIFWRQRAVRVLSGSPHIDFNLRARATFSGTNKTAQGDMRTLREELVSTVLDSDYGLDVRGDANESTRLYEILSLGRIPVIVDTERNFPFERYVNYDQFSLKVDFRYIQVLPEIIADFHASLTPEQFQDMQRAARDAFIRFFRIDAQMQHIVRELRLLVAQQERS